jgi:hypothetical protein
LIVFLEPLGSAYWRVKFGPHILIKRSRQPTIDAAQQLHKDGMGDEIYLISVRADEFIASREGAIGVLRRLKAREDVKAGPRYVMTEQWPADVAKRKREYELREGADRFHLFVG